MSIEILKQKTFSSFIRKIISYSRFSDEEEITDYNRIINDLLTNNNSGLDISVSDYTMLNTFMYLRFLNLFSKKDVSNMLDYFNEICKSIQKEYYSNGSSDRFKVKFTAFIIAYSYLCYIDIILISMDNVIKRSFDATVSEYLNDENDFKKYFELKEDLKVAKSSATLLLQTFVNVLKKEHPLFLKTDNELDELFKPWMRFGYATNKFKEDFMSCLEAIISNCYHWQLELSMKGEDINSVTDGHKLIKTMLGEFYENDLLRQCFQSRCSSSVPTLTVYTNPGLKIKSYGLIFSTFFAAVIGVDWEFIIMIEDNSQRVISLINEGFPETYQAFFVMCDELVSTYADCLTFESLRIVVPNFIKYENIV